MRHDISLLQQRLKQHGYSVTDARKAVFLALVDKEPQSISDLTRTTNGKVNRASLYRIIELFETLGIIERLQIGWKYKLELSNDFSLHHHHMTCIRCGRVSAFEESDIISFELKQLASEHGFTETGHQLELRGICASCNATK